MHLSSAGGLLPGPSCRGCAGWPPLCLGPTRWASRSTAYRLLSDWTSLQNKGPALCRQYPRIWIRKIRRINQSDVVRSYAIYDRLIVFHKLFSKIQLPWIVVFCVVHCSAVTVSAVLLLCGVLLHRLFKGPTKTNMPWAHNDVTNRKKETPIEQSSLSWLAFVRV